MANNKITLITPELFKIKEEILPYDLKNEPLIDKIILEIYNGWKDVNNVKSKLVFISNRIPQYAKLMNKTNIEFLTLFSDKRRINYANLFQNAYLPDLSNVTVFNTVDDYNEMFPSHKFICCKCNKITTNPIQCNARLNQGFDNIECNWNVNGLFGDLGKGMQVLFKDEINEFPRPQTIFKPIELT